MTDCGRLLWSLCSIVLHSVAAWPSIFWVNLCAMEWRSERWMPLKLSAEPPKKIGAQCLAWMQHCASVLREEGRPGGVLGFVRAYAPSVLNCRVQALWQGYVYMDVRHVHNTIGWEMEANVLTTVQVTVQVRPPGRIQKQPRFGPTPANRPCQQSTAACLSRTASTCSKPA
jgi:hypothetical protein